MKITQREISSIKPYENNPRLNDDAVEAVAASIREFGFRQPVVTDPDGVIIVGHTRYKAALKLGLEKVPVHVATDLSPEQVKAYRLADNRTGELAEWNWDLLKFELADLQSTDFDLGLLAFDDEELTRLLEGDDNLAVTEGMTDPDSVPEPPDEAISVRGEVYQLGNHRLMCGDSTSTKDVAQLMGNSKVDLLLTDSPYGVSYVGKTKDALKIENDSLGEDELAQLVRSAFDNAEAVCRPGAYWYATVPAGPLHVLFADDWKQRGILRQIMVWAKDSMVLGHSEYHYQHEPILFGWIPGKRHKNTDRTRTTLWQYDRPKASREHPTMKPIALWIQAVQDGSRKGELVYDPFLGSGTTIMAAEQTGRVCYGIEIEPKYCDVIRKRWAEFVHGENCNWELLTQAITNSEAASNEKPQPAVAG